MTTPVIVREPNRPLFRHRPALARMHPSSLAIVLATFLLAFGVRIAGLASPPLNGDEAFAVLFAQRNWVGMLETMRTTEPNPPLYFFVLKVWMLLAGRSEFSVRFLSVWFGVLAVPLTYVLGRRLGHWIGLLGALLVAVNPYLVWYSHFARAYSPYLTLTLASLVLALHSGYRTLQPTPSTSSGGNSQQFSHFKFARRRDWWAYVAVTTLALYLHYFAFLFLTAQNLIFLATSRLRRESRLPSVWLSWLSAQTVVAVLATPWLILAGPMLLSHKKAWLSYVPPATGLWRALQTYSAGVDAHGRLALSVAFLYAALLVVGVVTVWQLSRRALIVLGGYAATPLVLVLLGSLVRPIFLERYLIGVVPAFLILVAAGIARIADFGPLRWAFPFHQDQDKQLARDGARDRPRISNLRNTQYAIRSSLAALALIAVAVSTNLASPFGANFADWRGVVRALDARMTADDVVIQNYPDPAFAYYYQARAERIVLPAEVPIPREETDQTLRTLLKQHRRVWLLPNPDRAWDSGGFVQSWLDRRAKLVSDEWVAGHHLLTYRARSAPKPEIPHRLNWQFDNFARLVGYRLEAERVASGESFQLTLFWEPLRSTDVSYTVFVHLWDGESIWGQKDGEPQGGEWPTTAWFPGDLIDDIRQVPVDPEAPAGEYQLIAGLYRLDTGERLVAFDTEGRPHGDYVPLTSVEIEQNLAER